VPRCVALIVVLNVVRRGAKIVPIARARKLELGLRHVHSIGSDSDLAEHL